MGSEVIFGAVGQLQFEVMQYRLESEYGAPAQLKAVPWQIARWIKPCRESLQSADPGQHTLPAVTLDFQNLSVVRLVRAWGHKRDDRAGTPPAGD